MKSKAIRIGKRIMAVMLSLMMVVGVFAGMKLDVRAAGKTYWFPKDTSYPDKEKPELTWNTILYEGDIVNFETRQQSNSSIQYMNIKIVWENYRDIHEEMCNIKVEKNETPSITISSLSHDGKTYSKFKIEGYADYIDSGSASCEYLGIYIVPFDEDKNGKLSGSEDVVSSQTSISFHTCNFQWVTTIDPQLGADGLEEYKCTGCGLVKESHPIPASVVAVKDFYGKVKDAPANGTVTYDSGKLYTISDYLLKKMSERSDVAVTINFEYQNAKYELTFPAGTDFTTVLMDEETMYGYFGVAAKLGLTVVAK